MNLYKYYAIKLAERMLIDPFRIINPKREAILCSVKYTLNGVFKKEIFSIKNFLIEKIMTTNGEYYIRKGTLDIICCLPSYESEDINELTRLIKCNSSSNTLFVDIGADLGTYCISIMKNNSKIDAIAFEPNPESRRLLKKNLKSNKLINNIKVYSYAVSDISGKKISFKSNNELPGSSTVNTPINNQKHNEIQVETIKLDDILIRIAHKYDHIYIKMDIERNEKNAIIGSKKFLQKFGYKTILLIEDFLDSSFEKELFKHNFLPVIKLTPYNCWYKQNSFSGANTIK